MFGDLFVSACFLGGKCGPLIDPVKRANVDHLLSSARRGGEKKKQNIEKRRKITTTTTARTIKLDTRKEGKEGNMNKNNICD